MIVVYDNCTGQNKNNTMLKLLAWLAELGYFKKVTFIFLIVGHTKNAADRLFNQLKRLYRLENIFTMKQLLERLSASKQVTVHEAKPEDFNDYTEFLNRYYSDFKSIIKKNHVFSCSYSKNRNGNQLEVELRESYLDEDKTTLHRAIKVGFDGRGDYPKNSAGLRQAVDNRPKDIKAQVESKLRVIDAPGINPYKRVEMGTKYRECINCDEALADELYEKPTEAAINLVKKEKKSRANFRSELNETKAKFVDNVKSESKSSGVKRKLDETAFGDIKDIQL